MSEHSEKQRDNPPAPPDWSEFSQRLASFGLGEAPDPLLVRLPPPSKPRPRREIDPFFLP